MNPREESTPTLLRILSFLGLLFANFKVVLNPLIQFFLTLQKVTSEHTSCISAIKNGSHRARF